MSQEEIKQKEIADKVEADQKAKDDAAKAKTSKKKSKVKFIKSPTGVFNLGYNIGDEVSLPVALAAEVIAAKFATEVK